MAGHVSRENPVEIDFVIETQWNNPGDQNGKTFLALVAS
jgi:hypothetical protein